MENLTSIEFGNAFHTQYARSMRSMFSGCEKLQKLDLSGSDTSGVTNVQTMFFACGASRNVDVSGFDFSNVEMYNNFLPDGVTVNGEDWTKLFE